MPFQSNHLIIWLISSSVQFTRFEFVYDADDYDHSINEAIKISKYEMIHFLICLIQKEHTEKRGELSLSPLLLLPIEGCFLQDWSHQAMGS